MGELIMAVVKNLTRYLTGAAPRARLILPSVADPDAIHAVHVHLADAGFHPYGDTAPTIVDDAR